MTVSRSCPICDTPPDLSNLFVAEDIDHSRISGFTFASRKTPEYMCHRMVRCRACDLVFTDKPPSAEESAQAYGAASMTRTEEADDAALSYALAVRPTLQRLPRRDAALEIGTGTGAFLDHLKGAGFTTLVGIEPSSTAIAAAPETRRAWIRQGIFQERDFAPDSFDLICCFMTLEHVHNPRGLAEAAWRLLRPGGAFLTVTHDYRSLVNRLLGRRSPIIDIEHLQLFSRRSIRNLFDRTGFEAVSLQSLVNRYSLRYWLRLSPLPDHLKQSLDRAIAPSFLDEWRIGLNVGNTIAAGFRNA